MNKNARNILLLLLVFIIGIILMMYFFKSKYEEEYDTDGIIQPDGKFKFYPNTTISRNINDVIIRDIPGSYEDGQIPWTNYTEFSAKCENIPNCIGFNTKGYFFKESVNIIDSSFVITPYYKYEDANDKNVGFYIRKQMPYGSSLTKERLDEIDSFFRSVEKQVKCASYINETSDTIEDPDEAMDEFIQTISNSILFNIDKDIKQLEKLIPPVLTFGKIEKGAIASLYITGDPPTQKIDLVLVQGDPGPPGNQGKVGAKGDEGDTGAKGERGTTGTYATAYNPNIR